MSYHYIVFLDCTEERQQIIPRTVKHRRKSLFGEKVFAIPVFQQAICPSQPCPTHHTAFHVLQTLILYHWVRKSNSK